MSSPAMTSRRSSMSTPPRASLRTGAGLVPAHDDAGRVRAVRRVRDDDALGVAALGQVGRADDEQAGELAVGAGRRLQRGDVQAGDLGEPALELVHQLERALHQRLRLVRVQAGEAVEAGGRLVDARVVLHRARAERVAAAVHAVVERREPGEVAQQVDLADLGQARGRGAPERVGDELVGRDLGHAELGQRVRAPAGARLLVDGRAVRRRRGPAATGASLRSATVHLPAREDAAERVGEGVELGARALLGDGDEQDVVEGGGRRVPALAGHEAVELAGEAARGHAGQEALRHQRVDDRGRRPRQPHGELAEDGALGEGRHARERQQALAQVGGLARAVQAELRAGPPCPASSGTRAWRAR